MVKIHEMNTLNILHRVGRILMSMFNKSRKMLKKITVHFSVKKLFKGTFGKDCSSVWAEMPCFCFIRVTLAITGVSLLVVFTTMIGFLPNGR